MRRFAVLALLCLALAPPAAWSQGTMMPNSGQMPPGGGNSPMTDQRMMGPGMMGYGMMGPGLTGYGMMMGNGHSHIDGRIAFLRAELKLEAAQAKLFEPVEKVLRDIAAKHADHPMPMSAANQSLPDRLDAMEKFMAEHLDGLRALKSALTPFYAALSPQQREVADSWLFRSMM